MVKLDRQTLAERIAAELRRRILCGDLAAGVRLPAERSLAETYETNRNTLREAIRLLEMEGLVCVRHGSGVLVNDFRSEGQLRLLPHLLAEMPDPRVRHREIADLLCLRRLVLSETAALAALRATEEDLEALRRAVAAIEAAPDADEILSIELDVAFYRALAAAAHSHTIQWSISTFARMFSQTMEVVTALWVYPQDYLSSLTLVLRGVVDRQPEYARRKLEQHLRRGDEILMKALEGPRPAPRPGAAKPGGSHGNRP